MPGPTKSCCAGQDYAHFYIDRLKQNSILWKISWNKFFFIILNELMPSNTIKFKAKVVLRNSLGRHRVKTKPLNSGVYTA